MSKPEEDKAFVKDALAMTEAHELIDTASDQIASSQILITQGMPELARALRDQAYTTLRKAETLLGRL